MSETLYPHEFVTTKIYDIESRHPAMFHSFCYYIFPILTFIADLVVANHIGFYMQSHGIVTLPNSFLISKGIDLTCLIALVLITCGFMDIVEDVFFDV